ncbi:MAG: Hsp20/alpha crystallin family protein [Methanosarcinaceae archaeon]|nr:Hsp20/alpha crystallin family protein [Methanosarcinaceae archaeon]
MADKRRRRNLFDDIFGENNFEDIESVIDHIFNEMGINMDDLSNQPFVYGFSVNQRPGEEPEIHEFGNVSSEPGAIKPKGHQINIGEIEPLVDVFETEDCVHVVAEMPGIEKEDIQLDATDLTVDLKATHGERQYSEYIELPVKVDPDSAKATYHNGVLEVIFERLDPVKKTSIQIK